MVKLLSDYIKTDNGEYYASINTDKETGEENVLESGKVIGFKKL